ncbi:MAG: type ISP restriction/modification enzyme [Pseudomonadota bacterium]
MSVHLQAYLAELDQLYRTGHATEHSYRPALQHLLAALLPDVLTTNEPKRIACGAPDYILTRGEIPVGYIEAKDVGVDLAHKSLKEQFERYRNGLGNLIITDYLAFDYYRQGEKTASILIGRTENGGIAANPEAFAQFEALIANFAVTVSQSIKSPTRLAGLMAVKARLLANVIASALAEDEARGENTSLHAQMESFRQILIHDITPQAFADIYAQTIAYGLFAARYHDPSLPTFSRQEAATLIPKSNPFLRNLFQYVAGYDLDDRIVWIVDELITIFLATDVASIMKNFGRSTAQQDPVIHFYETFLAEYDPSLRKARGVWYTPQPVVGFIVRAVDDVLKTHFKLPEGLADSSQTTIQVEAQPGKQLRNKKSPMLEKHVHKVQILDPATGTGTFLAQTIRHLHAGFATMPGMWSAYVEQHLLPRLNGFELLMASYAMAHLKLDMLLTETGYIPPASPQRLRVFLTNSLEEYHPDTGSLFASWLSSEANEANHVKRDTPVMVVMGNPPYSGHSANKGEWIASLLEDYKQEPGGGRLQEKNSKWLNDDYVKFIRYGQHFVDRTGEGVLAFITNNGYLDNPTFRGMRWSLMRSFDEIYLLDLHGNSKKRETAPDGSKDENVFDIMQGVSIALMVKTGKKPAGTLATIRHAELFGKRQSKYDHLDASSLESLPWQNLEPAAPLYLWVPRDESLMAEFQQGFNLQELFPVNSVGIVTARDNFTIHETPEQVKNTIIRFLALDDEAARREFALGEDARDWKVSFARKDLQQSGIDFDSNIVPINYRPFDTRHTYYTGKSKGFHCMPRGEVMQHFLLGENVGLLCCRQSAIDSWEHVGITDKIVDDSRVSNRTKERGYVFPLYLYHPISSPLPLGEGLGVRERTPNLDPTLVERFAAITGLRFVPEASGDPATFAPVDLLDYIYAVLHSPGYRTRYREFLKTDFPRVPYPENAAQFRNLAALGGELRLWHLLQHPDMDQGSVSYQGQGDNTVDKQRFDARRVSVNASQYFDGVPESAWNFHIGGYQPAQKWLKDRKGRALDHIDIRHYRRIIAALTATENLMRRVDEVMTT